MSFDLEAAGLGSVLDGARAVSRFEVRMAGVGRPLALRIPEGKVVARQEFDARLVEMVMGRGGRFVDQTHARLLPEERGEAFRRMQLTRAGASTEVRARVVLACDGLRGPLVEKEPWARWETQPGSRIGIAVTLEAVDLVEPGTIGMYVGESGYVGLVGQNGGTHLGASVDPMACHRLGGPLPVVRNILESCGAGITMPEEIRFGGTGPLTGGRAEVGGFRVLAVGDACGYVEPFTGEGMSWAIGGAMAVVELLAGAGAGWSADLPGRWREVYRREIGQRQAWCRRLRGVIGRPAVAGWCMEAVRWAPFVPLMIARRISA